ncbi:MAG TPA: PfkB family carbohydrate kinase [Candidatus Baltobacteraceae bacterium]|jgi:hydroxymethylpyrimidine/phosphomethylpyrimidine kinase|nr:PfkB family carbohydrate kinase [Candidatus Baltobacteraceae bacterium]
MSKPVIASIGTTHPWNIAGVGLDAQIACEYGLPHAAAIVAVSAQDQHGLHAIHPVPAALVTEQLHSFPPGIAVYLAGALVSNENVRAVAAFVQDLGEAVVVVDPVLSVSLGGDLQTDADLARTLNSCLLTLPVIVTPNLGEVERLTGKAPADAAAMEAAARQFVRNGAKAALVTGGHLRGDPVDVLATAQGIQSFSDTRIPGDMRGCGSTLAAALACELALGKKLAPAVQDARAYVRAKIAAGRMRGGLQVAF